MPRVTGRLLTVLAALAGLIVALFWVQSRPRAIPIHLEAPVTVGLICLILFTVTALIWRYAETLLGPLFAYELIAVTRRGQQFGLRVLIAGVLLFAIYFVYSGHVRGYDLFNDPFDDKQILSTQEQAGFAESFLNTTTIVQLALIFLLTPLVVADAIARERENRTLEFLLVTP